MAACSEEKGVELIPWNERLQSTCFSSAPSVGGGSLSPSVRDWSVTSGCAGDDGLTAAAGATGARGVVVVGLAWLVLVGPFSAYCLHALPENDRCAYIAEGATARGICDTRALVSPCRELRRTELSSPARSRAIEGRILVRFFLLDLLV